MTAANIDVKDVKKDTANQSTAWVPTYYVAALTDIGEMLTEGFSGGADIVLRALGEQSAGYLDYLEARPRANSMAAQVGQFHDYLRSAARAQMSYATELTRLTDSTLSEVLTSLGRLTRTQGC